VTDAPDEKPAEEKRDRPSKPTDTSRDRLTQKQLSAIWSMGRGLKLDADTLRKRSVEMFNQQPEQLSKTDASALISKLGQLEVSSAMDKAGLSNVSVIEAAAAPLMRDPDFKGVTFVLSFFAALLIAIGSAVATEMLNPVMNSDVDVRHHLGLPVLAELPLGGIDTASGHASMSGGPGGAGDPRGAAEAG
jgi:hypothetical protein